MTRIFKNISVLCLTASMLTVSAFAGTTAFQKNDTEVTVKGYAEEKTEKNILCDILAPDMTYENLLSSNADEYGDILVYHNQSKTDDEGEFNFTADMSGRESGLYTVFVTDSEKVNLVYTDMEKNKEAILWLCGLTQSPSLDDFNSKRADLGLYNELYEAANHSEVAQLMYTAVQNGKLNFTDSMSDFDKRNTVIDLYNKMSVISGLNNKSVDDIMKYQSYLTLDESEISEYLDLSFNEKSDFKTELTKRMSKRGFKTEDEFYETLTDEFILSAVKYPDGYSNITKMLNNFSEDFGITKKVTSTIASQISGNDYETTTDLKNAINNIPSSSGNGGGGGGGSSSGGGGGKASSDKVPSLEIETDTKTENETKPKEYHIDIFTDLEAVPWAKDAIVNLAELDIIHGDGNMKFNPLNNVTREEFTKMVICAFAPDASPGEISFTDVMSGDWFCSYIKKAKALGIVNGISETMFGSGQYITRQDMAVIAFNAGKIYGANLSGESKTMFDDNDKIADYAKEAVLALKNAGIISGKGNNTFCPNDFSTRAEAAKIIYGLLEI